MGSFLGISQNSKSALKNPWVLGWLLLVAFVLVVNAVFISTAIITSPGLVQNDYYAKGQDHEQNIQDKLAAKNNLGWQLNLESTTKPKFGKTNTFNLNAVNKMGLPITGATVKLYAYRPSDSAMDFTQVLEETVPGIYTTKIDFPVKGVWELNAKITKDENEITVYKRVSVRPD